MWRRRVVPTRVAIYRVDSGDCDWNGNGGRGLGTRGLCKGWNNSVGSGRRLAKSLFSSLSSRLYNLYFRLFWRIPWTE